MPIKFMHKPQWHSEDDTAIRIKNLSKCYHIYDTPHDWLKQFFFTHINYFLKLEMKKYFREFWALKDISFEVKKGETVGIVGKNGSGKSTLLQIICGILTPTSGTVEVKGRIAALLELGSGFNPDFTGRENVYMNAAVLGLSKEEVDSRFDDIVAFADIGDFIDCSVKTYSSGMTLRLAFAVQSQIDPDILIVDEALSVGDAKFQAKCFDRLRQLKEKGTSILLVTHSGEQIVTHCSKAILLNQGQQLLTGDPRQVVNRYMDILFGKEKKIFNSRKYLKQTPDHHNKSNPHSLSLIGDKFSSRQGYNFYEYRWGDGTATILDYYIEADGIPYPKIINTGQAIRLSVSIYFNTSILFPIFGITIKTKEGITIYGINSEMLDCEDFYRLGKPSTVVIVSTEFSCNLAQGDYFISLGVASRQDEEVIPHDRRYDSIHFIVGPASQFFGLVNLDLTLSAIQLSQ